MRGSGSNADPTELVVGGLWTLGAAAILDVVGTLSYLAPDIKITGNATAQFYFVNRPLISGTLTKCEFVTFGIATGILRSVLSVKGSALTISDILFTATAGIAINTSEVYLTGNIKCAGTLASTFISGSDILGTSTITVDTSTLSTRGALSSCTLHGDTVVNINEAVGAQRIASCSFYDNTRLIMLDVAANNTIATTGTTSFLDNSTCLLSSTANARTFLALCNVRSLGLIEVSGQNGLTFLNNISIVVKQVKITVTTGTVVLCANMPYQTYWQASRSMGMAIINSTAITLQSFTPQYEPCLYQYDLTNYLFGIQYDLNAQAPNYTALYGTSLLWTPATQTLAAGGALIINTTGHSADGMNMAIQSFAGFALATSGTAAHVDTYYISFDGGVTWSGVLTLAQLQSNTYTINGDNYNTDPTKNIQLRMVLTSAGGGTITQVRVTGITYNPAVTDDWDIRGTLEDMEGTGFDTTTDSLKEIRDEVDLIEGVGFNTATDSLHALSLAIAAIGAAVAAMLAPILRGVEWLRMAFVKVFKGRINNDK